jgi:hypothetical protein
MKHINILFRDFNAKIGRDDIIKLMSWNKGLQETAIDNEVKSRDEKCVHNSDQDI